jgi:DNA repair photolyase
MASSNHLYPTLKGRGSSFNPQNRFERLSVTIDPDEYEPDDAPRKTIFYRDHAKTVIAYNKSPDIGFEASLSPYRGCEHGCSYCLSGDTRILMGDGSIRRLEDVQIGDEIYGTIKRGHYRRYARTRVLAHWKTLKPAYRITLEDGTTLISSGDHRFLTERGWKFVAGNDRPHLTINNSLLGTGQFAHSPEHDGEYQRGYLCGMVRGDANLKMYSYEREGRVHGNQYRFRLALIDLEALERTTRYLLAVGIPTQQFTFQVASNTRKAIQAIRTSARTHIERIESLIAWPFDPSENWCKGFLAGIFDAEGSCSQGIWRVSNTNPEIIKRIEACLERFGFDFVIEHIARERPMQVIRLRGGLREHLRFFHTTDPAITRKRDIEGQAVKHAANLRVASIEALNLELPLFDISTGTRDFIAEGVISHNCFARPTHEYLGFGSGLDFETKIMVKTDAPMLLRKELSAKKWKPQVIVTSAITDVYQPLERKLELTRKCLEVLLDFRNPVGIITKNHLITRDVDLLRELARYDAISVMISVTTLDEGLRRVMEPRTSTTERRLEAVSVLRDAGVHVGVLTAPIIPGLNDHEIPALVKAAVGAGAKFVGHSIVRLPYGVKDIFTDWLGRHVPDRKNKVLNRIRSMHDGQLSDARFGTRMRGDGIFADSIRALHRTACRQAGLEKSEFKLSTAHFRVPGRWVQDSLFAGSE